MTALCPGSGPSAARPGTDPVIALGGYALDAWVSALGVPELGPYIGLVAAGLTLVTANFCASDPPPDPGLQLSDFQELQLATSATNYANAVNRIRNWIEYHYWWVACECTGATTPAPPPVNLPPGQGTNTGLPTATLGSQCWKMSYPFTAPAGPNGNLNVVIDLTGPVLPPGNRLPISSPPAGGLLVDYTALPAGAYSVVATPQLHDSLPGGTILDVTLTFVNASGTTTQGYTYGFSGSGANTPWPSTMFVPANSTGWYLYVSQTDTNPHQVSIDLALTCSSTGSTTLVQPCCPPDPLVQNYLQLILNLVQQLYTTPAGASTSWTDGPAHAGITGTGSFPITKGHTAVRANFTTLPTNIRTTPGTPTFYWDLGFVTPVANTYPLRSLRTVFNGQICPLPPQADQVDYTFPSGAVVTLTELIPG